MHAAAASQGVTLRVISGWRSYASQAALYRSKGAYNSQTNPTGAAAPGTSNHERGRSVDLDVNDPVTAQWLRTNAAGFGFVNDVSTEGWHWTFQGENTSSGGGSGIRSFAAIGNPLGAIGGALTAPVDAVQALGDGIGFVVNLIRDTLLNPKWWFRVGWLLVGIGLTLGGSALTAKSLGFDPLASYLKGVTPS